MLKRTTVLLSLLWAGLPGRLSPVEAPPELREAMRARLEGVWKKDSVSWSRLTADEFTIVVPGRKADEQGGTAGLFESPESRARSCFKA